MMFQESLFETEIRPQHRKCRASHCLQGVSVLQHLSSLFSSLSRATDFSLARNHLYDLTVHSRRFRFIVKSLPTGLSTLRIEPVLASDNQTAVSCAADNGVANPVVADAVVTVLSRGLFVSCTSFSFQVATNSRLLVHFKAYIAIKMKTLEEAIESIRNTLSRTVSTHAYPMPLNFS